MGASLLQGSVNLGDVSASSKPSFMRYSWLAADYQTELIDILSHLQTVSKWAGGKILYAGRGSFLLLIKVRRTSAVISSYALFLIEKKGREYHLPHGEAPVWGIFLFRVCYSPTHLPYTNLPKATMVPIFCFGKLRNGFSWPFRFYRIKRKLSLHFCKFLFFLFFRIIKILGLDFLNTEIRNKLFSWRRLKIINQKK